MKIKLNILLLNILMFSAIFVDAQPGVFQPGDYKDGVYEKENAINRRYIPYTHLREGDVTWEKRVWRKIDLREKVNQPLYYPIDNLTSRISFIQLIIKYVLNGSILAFNDEEFIVPFEKAEIRKKLVLEFDSAETSSFDKDGNEILTKTKPPSDSTWIYRNFCSLDIKEDWFFDKQKSVLESRIIGLGISKIQPGKEDLGCNNMFWVYFPACRPYFAIHEVYNVKNDSERRTFEDIFWKRQFASTVYKESNVFDRNIDLYSKGIDALLESDRIKMDIFKWEHDLWHF